MVKKLLIIFSFLFVVLLGYNLRLHQFSDFPAVGDSQDELKYAFNGLSLIKNKIPESWSWWEDYGDFPITDIKGYSYRFVKPYFDEPPLFGLIMGAYSLSKGMDSFGKVDVGVLRWPMLKLGVLNIGLLFLLVYLVSDLKTAFVASCFYATIPTVVLTSRLPMAENFLVTLSLVSAILAYLYLKNKKILSLIAVAIICFCAPLAKQTGIYIPFGMMFLLIAKKEYRASLIIFFSMLLSVTSWFGYGLYYDWNLFIKLQTKFSGREISQPTKVINLFDTFRITEKPMATDGLIIWGWISIVSLSFIKIKKKFNRLIPLVFLGSYLTLFLIMSGHNKGWYRIPLYPFMSWAMAIVFLKIFKKPKFFYSLFFIGLTLCQSFVFGTGERFFSKGEVKLYQIISPLFLSFPLFYELTKKKWFKIASQISLLIVFFLTIYFNCQTIKYFQDQFWY